MTKFKHMAAAQGKLIVIDGIDGSGKATQTAMLRDALRLAGHRVESLDFPQYTSNFFGGQVRHYLDGRFGKPLEIDPHLASVLYAADRWESKDTLTNWLAAGAMVILDRYYTANMIHQAVKITDPAKRAEFISWLEQMELHVFKIPKPDLVLFLHVPATITLELLRQRDANPDGLDTPEHQQAAADNCLQLAASQTWKVVACAPDGHLRAKEDIHKEILDQVTSMAT